MKSIFSLAAALVLAAPVFAQDLGQGQIPQIVSNFSKAQQQQSFNNAKAAQQAAKSIVERARYLEQQLNSGGQLDQQGMKDYYGKIKQVLDYTQSGYEAKASGPGAAPADQAIKRSIKSLGQAYLRKSPSEAIKKVENIECDDDGDSYRQDSCVYLQRLVDAHVISNDDVMNSYLQRTSNQPQSQPAAGAAAQAAPAARALPPGCSQNLFNSCQAAGMDDFECKPCASALGN